MALLVGCYGKIDIIPIIVGAVCGFVTLVIIIIVIVCIYKKKCRKNDQEELYSPELSMQKISSNIPSTSTHLSFLNPGKWRERQKDHEECCICLQEHATFRSNCKHLFHFNCIIEWYKNKSTCPDCHKTLKDRTHRIYCRACRKKEKGISMEDLIKLYQESRNNCDAMCEQCTKNSK